MTAGTRPPAASSGTALNDLTAERTGRVSRQWRGVIREWADRLDVSDATPVITLGEGGTPLIEAPALSHRTPSQSHVYTHW